MPRRSVKRVLPGRSVPVPALHHGYLIELDAVALDPSDTDRGAAAITAARSALGYVHSESYRRAAARAFGRTLYSSHTCSPSTFINGLAGAELFFKCENLRRSGAFCARGASNAVFGLNDEQAKKKGVAPHLSGNHGTCLSYAAGRRAFCTVADAAQRAAG